MAIINEISLSRIAEFKRTDAEYFRPDYEHYFEQLSSCKVDRIKDFAIITDGIHGSPEVVNNGVRYISAKCVKDNEFVIEECINISYKQHETNPRTQLRKDDVIITTVGTIGNVAVADNDIIPSNCDRHVGIIRIKESPTFSPFYLSTFLNSKYGRFQSLREAAGNVQLNLYINNIGRIIVPRFEFAEHEIDNSVRTAYQLRREAKTLYIQAQELLESELRMDKFSIIKPVGYKALFSEIENSRRSDAQHYQPRFAQLLAHLATFQTRKIREIRTYNRRGVQPMYVNNGAFDVVNSQHLGTRHIDYAGLQKTSPSAYSATPEAHIRLNDILIYSTGAYVGRSNVYLSERPALASNHVNILRLNPGIDSAYMALVFQSVIGRFQTAKHARGSAQSELYPADIDRFIVPLLEQVKQKEIGNLVRESLEKHQESKRLLEQAKARVEQLIEEAVKS